MRANYKIIAALIGAVIVAALLVMAAFSAFNEIEMAANARQHNADLIARATALSSDLRDAETGQRGYALTGDETFLTPYQAVRHHVVYDLKDLRSRTLLPAAQGALDAMAPLVDAELVELSRVIELRRKSDFNGIVALVNSSQGKRLMDSMRLLLQQYIDVQKTALAQHEENYRGTMRHLFAIIVAASLVVILFSFAFAFLVYRETQHRLEQLVHGKTQYLLDAQHRLNDQLQALIANLAISEERLAVTLNSIGDAVIATDANGCVTLLNPLAIKLTGWSFAEAEGRQVDEIFHIINEETREPSVVPVRAALTRGAVQGLANHTILVARDGSECAIADSCAPIRERTGEVVGAVLVFRNVTENRRLDQALVEKNKELESAISVADKANLAKSDFLSSMSHELRTPLSAILGFAQLMETASPAPSVSQQRSIGQILQAGWYLLELINEILDLAQIESGKLSLSMEPSSLTDVLRECREMIEAQAQKRHISVTFPQFNAPYFVKADRTRVKQIFINLLSNAVKYNRPGGSVVVDCVVIRPDRIRISVRDSGAGLSPEKLVQLFQPFNRLGQEVNAEEGTGIGLVVSKQLVELMGGHIGVESLVDVGSVFWIELPLTEAPKHTGRADLPVLPRPAEQAGQSLPHSLLYVEDNPANLLLLEDLIARRSDIHLLIARDGLSGVEMARTRLPDVILMDINLPGISGADALQVLRDDPLTAHIPVIALSANAMPRDIEKGLAAGFFRYLTKPIRVNEFMETLDLAIQHAKADRDQSVLPA